jgi:hypothetical protein
MRLDADGHRQGCGVIEAKKMCATLTGVEAEVDANLKRAQALRQAVLVGAFALP